MTAQMDASARAKILSQSRSRGVFAGVALTGANLREDRDENQELYGRDVTNKVNRVGTPSGASGGGRLGNRAESLVPERSIVADRAKKRRRGSRAKPDEEPSNMCPCRNAASPDAS